MPPIWTADPSAQVALRVANDKSLASLKPETTIDVFEKTLRQHGNKIALRQQRGDAGKWREWTYSQYHAAVCSFASSLIHVGLEPHQCISIIGFNSPEWFIADIGAIFAGGIAAGIYTTNGPESCFYVADHSKARVIVVDSDEQLQKILQVRARLPHLRAVVLTMGEPTTSGGRLGGTGAACPVFGWDAFLALGARGHAKELQQRMRAQKPNECSTLIYTSGTTGNPKAVMLSHDNLTWTSNVVVDYFGLRVGEQCVSYLPLSHVAAQMTDIHMPLKTGSTVSFARPDALKGSLVDTLKAVRPTVIMGVPRVWEKIEEKMRAVGAANTGVKKSLGDWAKSIGLRGNRERILHGGNETVPWGWSLADKLVFSAVKANLGFDRCRLRVTGAAPISSSTMQYFMSLDMPLLELYGMSESTGPHTLNRALDCKLGSVGRSMPGVETKIHKPNEKGEGEICMRGRNVFMGYMHNAESTARDIDDDAWLHTGDLGVIDEHGFVRITGRIKELIITAGGENVPPVLIENELKAALPALSNVVVIGEKQKYLVCLMTLKSEPDADGQPTQQLGDATRQLVRAAGSSATTIAEAQSCAKVRAHIQTGVTAANANATSRAQVVQKFAFLPQDFTVDTGELTPTMKLKRRVVDEKYQSVIEELYAGAAPPIPAKL